MQAISQPRCTTQQPSNYNLCSVVQQGVCTDGVQDRNGLCMTSPSQYLYYGSGSEPPNTYVISSAGQNVSVAMGGCNVKPVGSPITDFAGFYETCSGKPYVSYSRTTYGPNYGAC